MDTSFATGLVKGILAGASCLGLNSVPQQLGVKKTRAIASRSTGRLFITQNWQYHVSHCKTERQRCPTSSVSLISGFALCAAGIRVMIIALRLVACPAI